MSQFKSIGKVILAGAGPGDADLITVKLQKALFEADVIITDRLVNPAIIDNNARPDAEIVHAGKQGYSEASISQEAINKMILTYALQGKIVLRLKGGDVAFFSNVLDELQALQANWIPYEIIPGITAAAGASAYTGIPLTARGYAQTVQLLTFNPNSLFSPEKWKYLASSGDTLVFYMAAHNVGSLAELLLRYTRRPSTPMAVIEQATTPYQCVHISTLKDCERDLADKKFRSPSLVIVGEVVKLYTSFQWFESSLEPGSLFNELIHQ